MTTATTEKPADLKTALSAAEQAAQEAAEAQARAAAAAARAAQAQAAADAKRQAAREKWARGVVEAFPADRDHAKQATAEARAAFQRAAVEEPVASVPAYLAYTDAMYRQHLVSERAKSAARLLGLPRLHGESVQDRAKPRLSFAHEVGTAIDQAALERFDALETARRAEMERVANGEDV